MRGRIKIKNRFRGKVILAGFAIILFSAADWISPCSEARPISHPADRFEQNAEKGPAAYDHWFVVKIAGQPAGYMHEKLEFGVRPAAGLKTSRVIRIVSQMKMALNRLGARIELELDSQSEESPGGNLLLVSYEMRTSVMSTITNVTIDTASRSISISKKAGSGAKPYVTIQKYSGDLLGLEAGRLLAASRLKNPGDAVSFQTFSVEQEKAVFVERKVLAKETVMQDRKGAYPVAALKIEESMSGSAVKRTVWVDNEGYLLLQNEPSPFGLVEAVRSDEAKAMSSVSAGDLPAEIFSRSIVRTNIRLPQPRSLDRIKVKINQIDPSLGRPDLNMPRQLVQEQNDGSLILEISRADPSKAASEKMPEFRSGGEIRKAEIPPELAEYIEPNAYIQSDDPEIRQIAKKIVAGEQTVYRSMKKLECWVADNMTFDLGIVFAPSAELMKNRRGTCVGYATLLASLARSLSIPSRILVGLVYTHGIFGGHAWPEVYASGEWIPFDAAIPADGLADAARIAFVHTSLRDGAGALSTGAAQQMFGNVRIEILEFGWKGKRTSVMPDGKIFTVSGKTTIIPPGAMPFSIAGDNYKNHWLGLSLEKPPGYRFAGLDAIWPDLSVVSIEGPKGDKAQLLQIPLLPWWNGEESAGDVLRALGVNAEKAKTAKSGGKAAGAGLQKIMISGRHAVRYESDAKCFLIIPEGSDAWVLTADGPKAADLIATIAKTLKIGEQKPMDTRSD